MNVRFARIDPNGPTLHRPKREGDVGWDLEAAKDIEIKPGESVDVPTNIKLELPDGVWATIRARSSVIRRGLQVEAGVIDTGYRGPLFVLTRNLKTLQPRDIMWGEVLHVSWLREWMKNHTVVIKKGERIGQVIFHRTTEIQATETDAVADDTQRGAAGFGSTGA